MSFAAIERSPEGALRFDLAGNDDDAWLEWHPPGSAPASFTGGLDTGYSLQRATQLGGGWFLVTYGTTTGNGTYRRTFVRQDETPEVPS